MKAGSLALSAFFFCAAPALADEALWKRLAQGGVAVMVRHAQTEPGIGDPPGFRIGECSTQRNLSAEGRAQARRLGAAFKARGIVPARVLSSQWCRCIDTATGAFGRHAPEPALNSFFDDRSGEAGQSAATRKVIAGVRRGEVLVLVTHQVNITALGGQGVGMGDLVLFSREGKLLGRLPAP
jgi:phosphohistidine phosphatase SixA